MAVIRRSGRSSFSAVRQRDPRSRSGDMEQVEERRPHPRPAPQAGAAAARRLRLRRLHRDEEDRRMAETAGMRMMPHVWGNAGVLAASLPEIGGYEGRARVCQNVRLWCVADAL